MVKIILNGQEISVPKGSTIMQACNVAGIEIPHFCYHERLSIAGNCRMCLVEIAGNAKPVASCAMPISDGMRIQTDSELVRTARHGVMEFLLINHPLDCPICDQGGECDLQDQALGYGRDVSRFFESKRAVAEKDFGPLIKTHMTRCIHCTRCVRFMDEIAGVPAIGSYGRGEDMEIVANLEAGLASSEMSGNIIDLCPVGALTSKPYAFVARSWELHNTESVDVLDAVGSNIRIDVRDNQVMRVVPRLNEEVNQEWIGDKSRFAYDGLRRQRLDRPYVRDEDGKLRSATWDSALEKVSNELLKYSGSQFGAVVGDLCDVESMMALKDLFQELGSPNIDCRQNGVDLLPDERVGYIFNTSIAGIAKSDLCLLIGTNPRLEAPLINVRLRERLQTQEFLISRIGEEDDLGYPVMNLGKGNNTLNQILDGSHAFSSELIKARRPMLILGQGALARRDGNSILWVARKIAEKYGFVSGDWNGFNVLHTAASRVGGLDLGLVPGPDGMSAKEMLSRDRRGNRLKLLYLLGADELNIDELKDVFVVYQGHHGDNGANVADVILPGAAYTEKDGCYVNTEGRPQYGRAAAQPPGEAKEDWAILRALSEKVGKKLSYDTFGELRARISGSFPWLGQIGKVKSSSWKEFGVEAPLVLGDPYASPVENYYMTDPISRASSTMLECTNYSLLRKKTIQNRTKDQ